MTNNHLYQQLQFTFKSLLHFFDNLISLQLFSVEFKIINFSPGIITRFIFISHPCKTLWITATKKWCGSSSKIRIFNFILITYNSMRSICSTWIPESHQSFFYFFMLTNFAYTMYEWVCNRFIEKQFFCQNVGNVREIESKR